MDSSWSHSSQQQQISLPELSFKLQKQSLIFYNSPAQYTKQNFIQLFKLRSSIQQIKSICSKKIQKGQTVISCNDCATNSSCIQCMDCFKNSDHQGHKFIIKKISGGCCDCGNVEAWKKEGFCKKHTGETIDIQIQQKQIDYFVKIMKQLFYLMLWEIMKGKQRKFNQLSSFITKNLSYMNQKGVYYNKLTYLFLTSELNEQHLKLTPKIKMGPIIFIIFNSLIPSCSKKAIDQWFQFFLTLFNYYKFKKLLLSQYIKNFTLIYGQSQKSRYFGGQITCQLLRLHQLVKQYSLQAQSIPLGLNIIITSTSQLQNIYYRLYHDLRYIVQLSEDTPRVYFRFHLSNQEGFLKMFQWKNLIEKMVSVKENKGINEQNNNYLLELTKYVKYFQFEYQLLILIAKIGGILINDKDILGKTIKVLFELAYKQKSIKQMIIYKPYHRALTLLLFSYFDMNLYNLQKKSLDYFIRQILQISQQQFKDKILIIFQSYISTYLFHSRILSNPGLNSTLYTYINFYKIKSHFINSIDILSLKILSLISKIYQIQLFVQPDEYLQNIDNQNKLGLQQKISQKQTIINNINFMLIQMNLITTTMSHELYITYQMLEYTRQNDKLQHIYKLYDKYIQQLLVKLIIQQKGILSIAAVKQYEQAFFHPKIQLVKKYLKKISTFDKVKKVFILQQHYLNQYNINNQSIQSEKQNSFQYFNFINYNDFRCNLTNKNEFQHPQNTLNFIKNCYNVSIYYSIFRTKTIEKFIIKIYQINKQINHLIKNSTGVGLNFNFDKFKPLLSQICRIVYIKKILLGNQSHKSNHNNKDIMILIQLIKKIPNVQNLLNSFQKQIIFGQTMQQQHQKRNQQLPISIISIKQSQKLLKQQQNLKKLKLKQKSQIKKLRLKQKFKKNTQKFEQYQKNIIQSLESSLINSQTKKIHSCLVCKNQSQQQMIYLVNISYHNHQKILNLGPGTLCLSIHSCYHTIDYSCYKKLKNYFSQLIKCPFCSFISNTFVPLDYNNKQYTSESIRRIQNVICFIKQFQEQISSLQQIIKSFYHFSLLSYLEPQRTINKRLQIYKIFLYILKSNIQIYDFNKVYNKYMNNQINLMPRIKDYDKYKKIKQYQRQIYMLKSVFSISESDINELEPLMAMFGWIKGTISNNNGNNNIMEEQYQRLQIISKVIGQIQNIKNKIIRIKQQKIIKQKVQYNIIMQQTFKRLFQYLGFKTKLKEQHKMHQKMQLLSQSLQPQHSLQTLPTSVQICLTALFTNKYDSTSIYQLKQQNNKLHLRNLPLNFIPLSKITKCDYCQQISSQICICLLCDSFKLCRSNCMLKNSNIAKNQKKQTKEQSVLSIKQNKAGYINHTSQFHGQQSLFLLLQTSTVFYINKDRQIDMQLGFLYKNQYGEEFNIKQDWNQFYLDQNALNKIKIKFLHEE